MPYKDKEKKREYLKRWYLENKERILQEDRENYQKNKEKYRERHKKYYQKNKDKIIQQQEEYYYNNKNKLKKKRAEYHKKYYRKNIEYLKNYSKEKCKENYLKNREERLNNDKLNYQKNKEKIRERQRKYNQKIEIKKRRNEQVRERKKIDKDFSIKCRLRNRLSKVFLEYIKTGKIKTSKLYGVDYGLIIKNLKPFPSDLSKYHIDHKIPLYSFNFINPDGSTNLEEIKKAFSPFNHQWLTVEDNLRKHTRQEKQLALEIK